jgi:hypothetical protein
VISAGNRLAAIAVTPDSKTTYAANYDAATVTPVQAATCTAGPPIKVGAGPVVTAHPSGSTRAP